MKRKIIFSVLFAGLLVGCFAVWYVFFKPHRNVGNEKAKYTLTADSLSKAFKADNAGASKQYIDQAIQIEGKVTNVEGITVSIENVACNIDSTQLDKLPMIKPGSQVKLQGLVVGYNDLMEEITLADCVFK